jgi:hypothetical protein
VQKGSHSSCQHHRNYIFSASSTTPLSLLLPCMTQHNQ